MTPDVPKSSGKKKKKHSKDKEKEPEKEKKVKKKSTKDKHRAEAKQAIGEVLNDTNNIANDTKTVDEFDLWLTDDKPTVNQPIVITELVTTPENGTKSPMENGPKETITKKVNARFDIKIVQFFCIFVLLDQIFEQKRNKN